MVLRGSSIRHPCARQGCLGDTGTSDGDPARGGTHPILEPGLRATHGPARDVCQELPCKTEMLDKMPAFQAGLQALWIIEQPKGELCWDFWVRECLPGEFQQQNTQTTALNSFPPARPCPDLLKK